MCESFINLIVKASLISMHNSCYLTHYHNKTSLLKIIRNNITDFQPLRTITTLGTTYLNIKTFFIQPTEYVFVFCIDFEHAIISVYCSNKLVLITQVECVYCKY
jgi:hypothetical protein